jgi:hypothetical protein
MDEFPPNSGPVTSPIDRRSSPRLFVRDRLRGNLVSLDDLPITIREISLGGFSIETKDALPPGEHVVRFTAPNRWSVTVTASSRYSRSSHDADGGIRYITGFKYEHQSPDTQHTIEMMFEKIASDFPIE